MDGDRIATAFGNAKAEERPCFIAYLCAGDPTFEDSLEACRTLIEGGVDILELGAPFSDPLADGLTNQLAAERALASGMTPARTFELVRAIRKFSEVPIVLYTYFNLVYTAGLETYAATAKAAGVDGVLILDLPPEEATEWSPICRDAGLHPIFIVAPTTPEDRLPLVTRDASGFIYYVSRLGVTGVRDSMASDIGEKVAAIRRHTDIPVGVGFGISRGDQVREVGRQADGVIVGSVLVNCLARNVDDPAKGRAELAATLNELLDRK